MNRAPLLLEIGCEEIPARMIPAAAADLGRRLVRLLDDAGLGHGAEQVWGGSRRLAVRVEDVAAGQANREEQVLGPPANVAFAADGQPTAAGLGFARKQGIDAAALGIVETDRGRYVGFTRRVAGRALGELLAETLGRAVAEMAFPKTMRWADGKPRWVRPVHWVLALHGDQVLPLELFGVQATGFSMGHRFLGAGPVAVRHPDAYHEELERAGVIVDPAHRRTLLAAALARSAEELQGTLVEDAELLEEVVDLVEWPGVVAGRFDPTYLELPRELLVTTLRHHQKCFSVQERDGALLAGFLAVANTDRDPAGHIRRGNEWVVGGRLEDARFFWREDRKMPLASRSPKLAGVVFHRKTTYADKAERMSELAGKLAEHLGLDARSTEHCRTAASLAKNDLVTGTVGEFPELQGQVGGLLLVAEGEPEAVARAVYAHYQPRSPDDRIPPTTEGCILALGDKLDTIDLLIQEGETPTGSRDPFGLRRASNGVFRIIVERRWPVALDDLPHWVAPATHNFLLQRFQVDYLKGQDWSPNEINAVLRPNISKTDALGWALHDIVDRLVALRGVRQREDFSHLVDLTKRVDNILARNSELLLQTLKRGDLPEYREQAAAARELQELTESRSPHVTELETQHRYAEIVNVLAGFVAPVDRFFAEVLVIDPNHPEMMVSRQDLLARLKGLLTRCFDIRELAGQADRRP